MSLDDWANNGWLRRHTATPQEIADLFAVADRDLSDCATAGLSDDWRFGIAYNAALQMAHAAWRPRGTRRRKANPITSELFNPWSIRSGRTRPWFAPSTRSARSATPACTSASGPSPVATQTNWPSW